MTARSFDQLLDRYAELAVKVGLNIQPDQSLLIGRITPESQVSFEAAPFVRKVVAQAYRAGAKIVDVHWGDRSLVLTRIKEARKETLSEVPEEWMIPGVIDFIDKGGAVMTIHSPEPDLMTGANINDLSNLLSAYYTKGKPVLDRITGGVPNWVVVCAATPTWAKKLYPNESSEGALEKLWDAIFDICRVRNEDPLTAWRDHISDLHARSDYLNNKSYTCLKYRGPGTDLTIGLPKGHIWHSGSLTTKSGLEFLANIPTEEVFTLPHRDRVDGTVRSSLALNYNGIIIDDFELIFEKGRVIRATAGVGNDGLQRLLSTEEGVTRLGEVALVPYSSPISQRKMLFYTTLYDENAASHLAFGMAYRYTIANGEGMSPEEFQAAGGNVSKFHIDFMMGNNRMDVDGMNPDGSTEPVMRSGEWAFDV